MSTIFEDLTFGELLKGYMERYHMAQDVLAEKLGTKPVTLQKWEENASKPSLWAMMQMAEIMNVPLVEIYKVVMKDRR